ncbi:MAG: DUF6142 family protein [Lachnospiraceae bacterium]|nr:DUF6142 family protein [Lachnospiraceae bacterium]
MKFGRKYLFTSNSRSDKGIMASVFALISLVAFFASVYMVLKAGGEVPDRLGAVGFVSCIFSLAGLVTGVMALIEKDTFRFFPRFGFGGSLASLLLWGGVIYIGKVGL